MSSLSGKGVLLCSPGVWKEGKVSAVQPSAICLSVCYLKLGRPSVVKKRSFSMRCVEMYVYVCVSEFLIGSSTYLKCEQRQENLIQLRGLSAFYCIHRT